MKKVLFLVNRDFVLYNFRVELVERLIKDGYEVYICLPYGEKVDIMVEMGCKFIPVKIDKRGTNPIRDMKLIHSYHKIFKEVKPDIILSYTTKCVIYSGILAGMMKIPYLTNVSGLGTAVEYESALQKLMIFLYKWSVKKAKCVFFQNQENLEFFQKHKMYDGNYRLIPGSGVNLEKWSLVEYPDDANGVEFLFIARVIKEKGIEEFLAVAKAIKSEYPNSTFCILGPCDGEYQDVLKEYEEQGIIKYEGMVQDTQPYIKNAHCTIHPSFYPEGISNVCLESAACGRPVITTDRAGCRETVDDGVTGFLFEQRNTEQLIETVKKFMNMPNEERAKLGMNGHEKVEREFDRKLVVEAYVEEIES
ncbi:MAG: glycosyltransferase family 4 protein [Lachnospiraceae bacterium]|nr:glycosyltransferase family 4 protein [Lachnospiraceae bacterium]